MEVELQDIIVTTIDYRGKTPKRFDSGIPVISSANVKKGKIIPDDKFVSLEYYLKYTSKGRLEPNDILITTEAPVGEIAIVPENGTYMISRRVFALRINQKKADPKFIFYTLLTNGVLKYFEAISHGATAPRLYKDEILKLKLNLPRPKDQKKIASVLSAYDDLIENNNQRIQLLEDMAQEIYKEWFVRFRFPDYQNTTFIDKDGNPVPHGTKGAIPEGWEKKLVRDIVKRYNAGKKYDNKTALESGKVPILDQGQSGLIGYHNDEPGVLASMDDPIIVFANHTCYQNLIQFNFSAIQNVLPFKSNKEYKRNIFWLHYATKDLIVFNDYKGHWPEFSTKKVTVPPSDICEKYGNIIKPMINQVEILKNKNKVLQDTRDLLLPRLISGKLSVDNIPLPKNELQMAAEANTTYETK